MELYFIGVPKYVQTMDVYNSTGWRNTYFKIYIEAMLRAGYEEGEMYANMILFSKIKMRWNVCVKCMQTWSYSQRLRWGEMCANMTLFSKIRRWNVCGHDFILKNYRCCFSENPRQDKILYDIYTVK